MRALLPALTLFLIAASASAQTPPAPAPAAAADQALSDQPTTLQLRSKLVFVPAQIESKKGAILYDLKPGQFTLTDNGVPQTLRVEQDTDALGLSVVVVVQCSRAAYAQFDSMHGLPAMLDQLTGGAPRQVALVSYGDEPTLLTPFTSDPDKIADGFTQLEPCDTSAAATLDAVNFAIHLFDDDPAKGASASANRRAILLISETHDHGSKIKAEMVVANLGRTNTIVDSVSFEPGKESILGSMLDYLTHGGPGPSPVQLIATAVQALKKNVPHTLSELSGGEYSTFSTGKRFDQGVQALANHIHNFYLISFTPSGPSTPGLHRLQVKVPDYPDARIRARETYYEGDMPPPELPPEKKKLF